MVSFIPTVKRLNRELRASHEKTKMSLHKNNEMCRVVQLRPDCVLIAPKLHLAQLPEMIK